METNAKLKIRMGRGREIVTVKQPNGNIYVWVITNDDECASYVVTFDLDDPILLQTQEIDSEHETLSDAMLVVAKMIITNAENDFYED